MVEESQTTMIEELSPATSKNTWDLSSLIQIRNSSSQEPVAMNMLSQMKKHSNKTLNSLPTFLCLLHLKYLVYIQTQRSPTSQMPQRSS
jgi:hypothetical protein